MSRTKLGLVLGGGGARGLAHIGVLRALEEEKIPFTFIGGSSMGALIGGMYAQNQDAAMLQNKIITYIKKSSFKKISLTDPRQKIPKSPLDLFSELIHNVKRKLVLNFAAERLSLLKADRLQQAVIELLSDGLIEECKIPFVCVATDLNSGNEIIFRKGHIRKAVEASSAIPGFLPPVQLDGYLLMDGSVSNNFPIAQVRKMGANKVIAVNVSLNLKNNIHIDNIIDLVMRSAQITARKLDELLQMQADLVIRPDISDIHWSEFSRAEELIQIGLDETRRIMPQVKKLFKKRLLF